MWYVFKRESKVDRIKHMEWKYAQIKGEETVIEIEKEIERLEELRNQCYTEEQVLKIFLNSMYGATGSEYFSGYDLDISTSITRTGKQLIQYMARVIDEYFINEWKYDTELHTKLGITVKKEWESPISEYAYYADTDSNFVTFEPIIQSVESGMRDELDFILGIYENRLKGIFNNKLKEFAHEHNTENIQDFELENVSYVTLMNAPKSYITDIAWKDPGVKYKSLDKLYVRGLAIVQSSTPKWCRDKLKKYLEFILKTRGEFDWNKFVVEVSKDKNEYMSAPIDDISLNVKINEYSTYVIDDSSALKVKKFCPIHVKGAAIYNYLLKQSKYHEKYKKIQSGEKVKYFYINHADKRLNVFSYIPGEFPAEFAPVMDLDEQFEKTILVKLNKFMKILNKPEIPKNLKPLKVKRALF